MLHESRTFRVFLSSTFEDLRAERDALDDQVFPRLERLCAEYNCRFQAIDLRWGVSAEATLDHQTLAICLEEIARCQRTTPRPNFLVLLGERYGWQPLPVRLSTEEFHRVRASAADEDQRLLAVWFEKDENSVPAAYLLKPRVVAADNSHEDRDREAGQWKYIEAELRRVLLEGPLPVELRRHYETSATEAEIRKGALTVEDAGKHVFCFFRTIRNPKDAPEPILERDESKQVRLNELKGELRATLGNNVHNLPATWTPTGPDSEYLTELCERVYSALSGIISAELSALEQVSLEGQEAAAHLAVLDDQQDFQIGQDKVLDDVVGYLAGESSSPLRISGDPGSGRTCVMSQAIRMAAQQHKDALIFYRFVGATARSSGVHFLLEDLHLEISHRFGIASPIPRDLAGLVDDLPRRLDELPADTRVILFLDDADAVDGWSGEPLAWLPRSLKPQVRVVVSTLPANIAIAREASLASLGPAVLSKILRRWLRRADRDLQEAQTAAVVGCAEGNPLALKLGFEASRFWRSQTPPPAMGRGVAGMVNTLLESLERDAAHGEPLVRHAFGLLSAARAGLAEDELLKLLSRENEVLEHAQEDVQRHSPGSTKLSKLPVVLWSRLFFAINPFLARRNKDGAYLYSFRNRAVQAGAKRRYLQTPAAEAARHQAIAALFQETADPGRDRQWGGNSQRAFRELAFHLHETARASGSNELFQVAGDSRFWQRQFEVLRELNPVVECLNFALMRATACQDAVLTLRTILDRKRLKGLIDRSFRYRLESLAKADPEFARSVADSTPDAGNRIMALALVAWVASRDPQHVPFSRRLLRELPLSTGCVAVYQAPFLLFLIRELVRAGLPEARGLTVLIPECPLLQAAMEEWSQGDDLPSREVAAAPRRTPRAVASLEEVARAKKVEHWMTVKWQTGVMNRKPKWVVEEAAHRFGETGPATAMTALATTMLISADFEAASVTLGRALFESTAATSRELRTRFALMETLAAAGLKDLSKEFRAQISSSIQSGFQFFRDPQRMEQWGPVIQDLTEWHPETFTRDPGVGPVELAARNALAKLREGTQAWADAELHRSVRLARKGRLEEARSTLSRIVEKGGLSEGVPDSLILGCAGVAVAVQADSVRSTCRERLARHSLNPDEMFGESGRDGRLTECLDALLQGTPGQTAAAAFALRALHHEPYLFQLILHLGIRGAGWEVVDAATSELPRMVGLDDARRLTEAFTQQDESYGVAQYLGAFYFPVAWQLPICAGLPFIGLGIAEAQDWRAPAVLYLCALAGAVQDLWNWKRAGLKHRPEISRRWGFNAGAVMSLWSALFLLEDDVRNLVSSDAGGYGLLSPVVCSVVLAGILGWVYYNFGSFKHQGWWRMGLGIAFGVAGAIASPWVAELLGADWQRGFFLGGTALVATGLSVVVKYLPVRSAYDKSGIRFKSDAKEETLGPKPTAIEIADSSPLKKRILRAQAWMQRSMRRAHDEFASITQDPAFATLPPKTRYTVHLNKGFMARKLRQPRTAVEDYARAMACDSQSPSAYLNFALVWAQELKNPARALEGFMEAIVRDPSNAEAFSSRGIVKSELGDLQGSIKDHQTAISLDPGHPDPYTNLANVMVRLGRWQEAAEYLDRALEIAPRDQEVRNFRGRIRSRFGV